MTPVIASVSLVSAFARRYLEFDNQSLDDKMRANNKECRRMFTGAAESLVQKNNSFEVGIISLYLDLDCGFRRGQRLLKGWNRVLRWLLGVSDRFTTASVSVSSRESPTSRASE